MRMGIFTILTHAMFSVCVSVFTKGLMEHGEGTGWVISWDLLIRTMNAGSK